MSKPRLKKRFSVGRVLGLGLAAAIVITLTLVLSLTVRVTKGVSRTVQTPEHVIRLEILNGCSTAGIAALTSRHLAGYSDGTIEIVVVGTGDFDIRDVKKTFIISRGEDKTAAEHLAGLLGIEKSEVVYNSLANNYRQISATLVLGENFVAESLAKLSDKE